MYFKGLLSPEIFWWAVLKEVDHRKEVVGWSSQGTKLSGKVFWWFNRSFRENTNNYLKNHSLFLHFNYLDL